jgi:hypothetical protein
VVIPGRGEFLFAELFEPVGRPQTGAHALEGVFLAAGPPIRPGVRVDDMSILDVAPTLLAALGLPVPAGMPGRVVAEALVAGDVARSEEAGATAVEADDAAPLSAEEEALLERRLADLGYL